MSNSRDTVSRDKYEKLKIKLEKWYDEAVDWRKKYDDLKIEYELDSKEFRKTCKDGSCRFCKFR